MFRSRECHATTTTVAALMHSLHTSHLAPPEVSACLSLFCAALSLILCHALLHVLLLQPPTLHFIPMLWMDLPVPRLLLLGK